MAGSPRTQRPAGCRAAVLAVAVLLFLVMGCAARREPGAFARPFSFQQDTLSYTNELLWEYYFDADGKWTSRKRQPPGTYTSHCFVMVRAARQFFQHARFEPNLPVSDRATYRTLVRRILGSSPRHEVPWEERVIFPGYANLREFSAAWEELLKAECGGGWQSYVQVGHWRVVFPFSRGHQEGTSQILMESLERNRPPAVHLVRFPQLSINHALLVYRAEASNREIRFDAYDPNHPERPTTLTYDRQTKTFTLPYNDYFYGGRVDVYEVYCGAFY